MTGGETCAEVPQGVDGIQDEDGATNEFGFVPLHSCLQVESALFMYKYCVMTFGDFGGDEISVIFRTSAG